MEWAWLVMIDVPVDKRCFGCEGNKNLYKTAKETTSKVSIYHALAVFCFIGRCVGLLLVTLQHTHIRRRLRSLLCSSVVDQVV